MLEHFTYASSRDRWIVAEMASRSLNDDADIDHENMT